MEGERADDIKSEVSVWIQGKHGMIGVILPKERITPEERKEFYKAMAIIAIRSTKRKNEEEAE